MGTKLEDVAEEIRSKYSVKTVVIAVDFTDSDAVFQKIKDGVEDLDGCVGLLINNVGMSYDHPEYFLEIENCGKMTKDLVSCNVSSVLNVTRAVLPGVVERCCGEPEFLFCSAVNTPLVGVLFHQGLRHPFQPR